MAEQDYFDDISRVIALLTAAVTNTGLYSPAHPQVAQYVEKAYSGLTDVLHRKPEITILLIGNDLIIENRQVVSSGTASYVSNFTRILKRKAVERLTFVSGLPRADLQSFIQELASSDAGSVRSTDAIKLGKVDLRARIDDRTASEIAPDALANVPGVAQEAMQELLALSASELDELKELYINVKRHKKIDVRGVDDIVKSFIQGFRQEINPLNLLATLKSYHEYTFTHVSNVCILTMSQAETLGFKGEYLHQIGVAALLHDVGKVFIPEEIITKAGKLTPEERKVIESHSVKGARYLMGLDGIPKLAVVTALEHHLKFDGSGYPSIKGGWRPNIVSQMMTVADVFDAMRSNRNYQGAQPMEKIVEVLTKGRGSSFNPQLVDHFFRMIRFQQ